MFLNLRKLFAILFLYQVSGDSEGLYSNISRKSYQNEQNDEIEYLFHNSNYNYVEEPDDAEFTGPRYQRLFPRDVDYDQRSYLRTCGRTYRVRRNKIIRIVSAFHGVKQYWPGTTCDWDFLGSKDCIPQICCETIDLRSSQAQDTSTCDEEYLLLFDGAKGWLKLCEETSAFRMPKIPSQGKDLFLVLKTSSNTNFSRLFKGIRCEVSCNKDKRANQLPEQSGLLKEEAGCGTETDLFAAYFKCGAHDYFESRIIGGSQTVPFEYPWMVGIAGPGTREVLCGGSLINSQYVLTAAHCFEDGDTKKTFATSNLEVLVHLHDRNSEDLDETTLRFSITRVICHPFYGQTALFDFDACILKLNGNVNLTEHHPVCLPPASIEPQNIENRIMTIAGWGRLREKSDPATVLNKAQVRIQAGTECIRQMGRSQVVKDRMFCAGILRGGIDACTGDSGGPLVSEHNIISKKTSLAYQFGLVSWGRGCGRPRLPGVYTFIPAVVSWIRKTAMNGIWCATNKENDFHRINMITPAILSEPG